MHLACLTIQEALSPVLFILVGVVILNSVEADMDLKMCYVLYL